MSTPSVVKGQFWNVAVSPDGGQTYTAICGLTSRNLTNQLQTGSEYIRDCQDPSSVPFRVVNITGQQFDIAGTGVHDRRQGALIRSIFGRSLPYRFIEGEDASDAVDSGYYQGNFVFSNHQLGAADGANVTAQFTFESDGQIVWVAGADIIVLDPLFVAPTTATHAVAYSGTIAGKTAASTITATSSDGTALTVTNGVVSGTFPAAGPVTVTLTETLAAAPNSPKTSQIQINVA